MPIENDPDLRPDPEERSRHAPPRRRTPAAILVIALILALAGAAWWWYSSQPQPAAVSPPSAAAPAAAPASAASAAASHPLQIPEGTVALAPADVEPALVELLGSRAVASFLETGDFPRRVVATVDNLGRASAPTAAWPVHPTPGQFQVQEVPGGGSAIAPDNATRYTPLVLLVGTLDVKKVVELYRRMYPLLQASFRDLGFGQRDFNERVVEVIDLLLATPEPAEPPRVELPEVKGPYALERPWVRYRYSDPTLESLTSGQKILVRIGAVNERRLKQKLRDLRAEILAPPSGSPVR